MSCQGTFFNVRVRIALALALGQVLRMVVGQTLGKALALLQEGEGLYASVVQPREAGENVGDDMAGEPQRLAASSNKDTKDMAHSTQRQC